MGRIETFQNTLVLIVWIRRVANIHCLKWVLHDDGVLVLVLDGQWGQTFSMKCGAWENQNNNKQSINRSPYSVFPSNISK